MSSKKDENTGRFLRTTEPPKEELEIKYLHHKRSTMSIGLDYGCSSTTVSKWLKKYTIEIRKPGSWRQGTGRNLTGKRFGKLVVKELHPICKDNDRWITVCDCGRQYICRGFNLVHGIVTQCRECSCPTLGYGSVVQIVWGEIIRGARKRRFLVELTVEEADKVYQEQHGLCALSGMPIYFAKTRRAHNQLRLTTASLDRINPDKGYISGNVQWVHKTVNLMKQKLQDNEFIEWCKVIVQYQESKK